MGSLVLLGTSGQCEVPQREFPEGSPKCVMGARASGQLGSSFLRGNLGMGAAQPCLSSILLEPATGNS